MTEKPQPAAIKVFYSYAHEDEAWRKRLDQHFSFLRREEKIGRWFDGELKAGERWRSKIDEHLNSADVILLLVSAAFADSEFCYSVEMKRAMERHEAGEAVVVPIFLHPCDWKNAPFAELQALPGGDDAISEWQNTEKALYEVARGVRELVDVLIAKRSAGPRLGDGGRADTQVANVPPPPAIDFVPRKDREGRDISERLKRELMQRRPLVLWGEGGVGKTTIAAEAARALAGAFAERIVWTSAEKRADFTYVTLLNEIAARLGDPNLTKLAPEPKEQAVGQLVVAAPTLIILDNFETVSPDEKGKCLEFLTARAECSSLITTRERVIHDAARHIHVESMDEDEARQFVERWIKQEAHAPRTFEGLDYNEIIRAADARPYVLQWVLARIDLALEPRTLLDGLTHAEGEVGERVFERSFQLPQLGDDGRDTLLALSLFTPSAARPALAEVAGFRKDPNRLTEAVKRLAALRLIETTPGGERLTVEGLTRSLSQSRLSTDKRADEFRRRYVRYFLNHASSHKEPVTIDLDALEAEKDNVLMAIDTAYEMQDWESVMRIREVLNDFFYLHGHWDEAIRSGELAEAAARNAGNESNALSFMANVGAIRRVRGEYAEAERAYRKAVEYFRRVGDEHNVAAGLQQLAIILGGQGELEVALRLSSESVEIRRKLEDEIGLAGALHSMALIREMQHDMQEARRLYTESLELSKLAGLQSNVSRTLNQLAGLAWKEGDLKEAKRLSQESLEIKRELGDLSGIASSTRNLGLLAIAEGNQPEALRLFREAIQIFEKLGSPWADDTRRHLTGLESESD